ncbi:gluconate 2-dehydrogenase subunit 3 family protein [Marinilongibacter aquaticus]|uniref:gluconate 2-dehydrogenase subunit 3 family protein n=1 Tax=Marinilongibacter aquaticus TaxID=2975157 RepID=UPI0021BDDCFD|nr:gluconate 2-dehydrogenase subunit 3 family protein [Marinilongibacter aquaticus]UBM60638.1 gluconate 2-dehydrogenase subunit 3 family protein [Marinilongibacter aquaticus]
MKRRDVLKNIGLGTAGVAVSGKVMANEAPLKKPLKDDLPDAKDGFTKAEILHNQELNDQVFFNPHEMATIAILADIIIPADSKSGSATEAGVPEFIEFIVKDMPYHQIPMRGGLMWLDRESVKQFGKKFVDASKADRLKLVDQIAYPEEAKPEMSQGVAFFNKMRDLTTTGFYTSEIGVKDLDYRGNTPNVWDGVPEETLKKFNLSYDDWAKHLD